MHEKQKEEMLLSIRDFRLPKYDEIPDVGLFLEQTTKYISGCFLIGLLYSYFKHKATTASVLPLLLMTGVLGGFTTFSTFSLETIQLLQQNEYLKTILYVVGSVGLGLTACFWGIRQF